MLRHHFRAAMSFVALLLVFHVAFLDNSWALFAQTGAPPSIEFTFIPSFGSFQSLKGRAPNAEPKDFRVVVLLFVPDLGWFFKPTCADLLVPIQNDGTWAADVTTGGVDDTATKFAAFLVPATFSHPCNPFGPGFDSIPIAVEQQSVARVLAVRSNPNQRRITFSGYDWLVKSNRVPVGPDGNYFSDSTENVWVDEKGRLHLRIVRRNGIWYAAEIISTRIFGYGAYRFFLDSRVDNLDPNVVLGLFTWDDDIPHREIDIEFSRWGQPNNPNNAQFVVQPFSIPQNIHRFQIPLVNASTHSFLWEKDRVLFQSLRGHTTQADSGSLIQQWEFSQSESVPQPGAANARINLWLGGGRPPAEGQEIELIIKNFEFVPASAAQSALFFPRLVSKAGDSSEVDNSEMTGVALANLDTTTSTLHLTAYDTKGTQFSGPGITNPAALSLTVGQQEPLVDFQLFGPSLPQKEPVGWFKVESSVNKLAGFFLMFNSSLTFLDGADVGAGNLMSFIFPEIEELGFTQLHVVNPTTRSINVNIVLINGEGATRGSVTRAISANGALAEFLSELYPALEPSGSDYIRVSSPSGVVPFQFFGRGTDYVAGLNGQDATRGSITLFSPQFAVGGPLWRSALSVVNLESIPGTITLEFFSDTGTLIARGADLPIGARGKIAIRDQNFFVNAGNSLTQGFVKITSNGVRLAGSVLFGDQQATRFASALPLISSLQNSVVFSQLASNSTYFTGIAILRSKGIILIPEKPTVTNTQT